MRIADDEGRSLTSVYLALSDAEAVELIDALQDLRTAKKGWHVHVGDTEYGRELTIYREDDEVAAF